jgi:hypothetical protein
MEVGSLKCTSKTGISRSVSPNCISLPKFGVSYYLVALSCCGCQGRCIGGGSRKSERKANSLFCGKIIVCLMFSDSTFAGLQTEGQSSFMLKNVRWNYENRYEVPYIWNACLHIAVWIVSCYINGAECC